MYCHMPFLYPDGMAYAAVASAGKGKPARWKLHLGRVPATGRRLHTGLPDDVVECSPSVLPAPGGLIVYFVGQQDGTYRFYRVTVVEGECVAPALPVSLAGCDSAHAGTRSPAFEAADRPEVAGIAIAAFGQPVTLLPYERFGVESVARLSFEYARPWRLLVSGYAAGAWQTFAHDLKTGETARIVLADGRGVYKGSIGGDRLAYAERLSEDFEAREIRFAEHGEWRMETLPAAENPVAAFASAALSSDPPAPVDPVARYRREREECLRANCRAGRFCGMCRNHPGTRIDLEWLGLVRRDGEGCPRGLAWNAPETALAVIRPGGGAPAPVWCERFMIGTTPAMCQQCLAVRQGTDADAAARWLQRLAHRRRTYACAARARTDARRMQECCGRAEKEIAVYRCTALDREVEPGDCRNCGIRTPPETTPPDGGTTAC